MVSKVITQRNPQAGGLTVSGSWVQSGSCRSPGPRHLVGALQREEVAALMELEMWQEDLTAVCGAHHPKSASSENQGDFQQR